MAQLPRMPAGGGLGGMENPPANFQHLDTAEQIYISSIALLKMLKHARARVPVEVMGLLMGDFVDEYTVRVVDAFALPQCSTDVSVEAIDEVFQNEMLDLLKLTGRSEMVVGWYRSHAEIGCWLSVVDMKTQMMFEGVKKRAIAVVVDTTQCVRGKVAIEAFRLVDLGAISCGLEPRQRTSNLGYVSPPSDQVLMLGWGKEYYSMPIVYRKNELERKMLVRLHKEKWGDELRLEPFDTHSHTNEQSVQEMARLAAQYTRSVHKENELGPEKAAIANVGKRDAKKHLEEHVANLMSSNILQTLGTMLHTIFF